MRVSGNPVLPDALSPAQARILAAVVHLSAKHRRVTVRDIGEACGLTSSNTPWFHLKTLRELGLVHVTEGKQATITPAFTVCKVGS